MEIVQEDKALDDYGFVVELGRDEIEGGCTTKSRKNESYYVLLKDESTTFIDFHLVTCSKFLMIMPSHR
jgi:hypothetical protein